MTIFWRNVGNDRLIRLIKAEIFTVGTGDDKFNYSLFSKSPK